MEYTYVQSTGAFIGPSFAAQGYSGFKEGKNNPEMEDIVDIGPIPSGKYTCLTPIDSKNLGPDAIALIPEPGTNTYGRSAFYIHGDSVYHPGLASHGCIILPPEIRKLIIEGDVINVVASLNPQPLEVSVSDGIEMKEDLK